MSSNRTCHTWVQYILQLRPNERMTRVRNQAQLIAGIYKSKLVHLSQMATKIVSNAVLLSVVRRLARFLDKPAMCVREWYEPIVHDLLASAAATVGEIRLIADASQVGFHHQLLMISLAYRRRALPLVWTWICTSKGHSSMCTQLALLGYLHRLLPAGIPMSLVGDSEFGSIPIIRQIEEWGWYYVLRQKTNHQVQLSEQAPWRDFGRLVQRSGQRVWAAKVQLTLKYAHPTNLLAHWQVGEAEPWLLATKLPTARLALQVYARRM